MGSRRVYRTNFAANLATRDKPQISTAAYNQYIETIPLLEQLSTHTKRLYAVDALTGNIRADIKVNIILQPHSNINNRVFRSLYNIRCYTDTRDE